MGTTWFQRALACVYPGAHIRAVGKHLGCTRTSHERRYHIRKQLLQQMSAFPTSTVHAVIARHPATFKARNEHARRVWEAYYNAWASIALTRPNVRLFQYEALVSHGCTSQLASREKRLEYANRKYRVRGDSLAWRSWNYTAKSRASARVYLHIPRTGGSSILQRDRDTPSWHTAMAPPPQIETCAVEVSLRDATERYLSEWNFYGRRFFQQNRSVKGWRPATGFTPTFAAYSQDVSTHNSMVKLLSGCNLYAPNCSVTRDDVARIVQLIRSRCLTIRLPEARVHVADYGVSGHVPVSAVPASANELDALLVAAWRTLVA